MACEIVNAELNPLIERLAPAIPLNDRMIRIYAQAATNASRTIRLIDVALMMFVHRPKRYLGGIIQHFPAKWGPVPRPLAVAGLLAQ